MSKIISENELIRVLGISKKTIWRYVNRALDPLPYIPLNLTQRGYELEIVFDWMKRQNPKKRRWVEQKFEVMGVEE